MAIYSSRGQVMIEALWVSLVVFSLIFFLIYFSFEVEGEHKKNQFQYGILK